MFEETYLTVAEAAKIVGVNRDTLRRWTKDGSLPYIKLGGPRQTRIRRTILEAFMRNREVGLLRVTNL